MRTVYLGTSDFAAAVLERLAASEHRPALVVTRPDRPRGRGRALAPPPVAVTARALDLELDQPDNINAPEGRERIAAAEPEAVCVCAFGALIKEPLLSSYAILNVHPSLLPRWRGAAPIERAIMAGDRQTGASIMRVVEGLDSGPVCLAAAEAVSAEDSYGTLAPRLQRLGGDLLVRALDERPPFVEQDESDATYAQKIGREDRLLDPGRPAEELGRVVRALHPHVGARLPLVDGTLLGVRAAAVLDTHSAARPLQPPAVGQLASVAGRLLLGCAPGLLELLVVQPPGGRAMPADAYLRGRGLPVS